jgi:hypothetical protein
MTENQKNQGKQRIDPDVFIAGDAMCDGYYMRDPGVTREMAQQAAIDAMRATRQIDDTHGTHFGDDEFALKRLKNLGVDPDTLEVL